ncbi:MAG: hypothetical protein FWC64_06430, partial [Treponema sp.]|nr:hypothetical protein [Treponema sp.]
QYKDSVFSLLFSDPDILKELYGALGGVALPDGAKITINTLEDALFMDRINDISFVIDDKLVVLVEHQSTINENMPFRFLEYGARVYGKIVEGKNIYSSKRVRFPRPEFYALYIGTDEFPDEKILRLSDSFEDTASLGLLEKEGPALELVVKVININHGKNKAIADKCETLAHYSAFVDKEREFAKTTADKTESLTRAVKYCIEHGILEEFLKKHGTEVVNMLFQQWNMDDALAVRFEEGMEKGREETARNALSEGASADFVHRITGLDMETIQRLDSARN